MAGLVIYPSKTKMLAMVVGSLMFVTIGVCFVVFREAMGVPLVGVVVVSYVGVPFFGLCFAYAAYRLLAPKPAVVVNEEGILDSASAVGAGMLRWEEIAEVVVYDFMGQRILGIVPVDAEAVIARQRLLRRLSMRISRGMGLPPFNIPQATLPMSVDELLAQIMSWRERAGRKC